MFIITHVLECSVLVSHGLPSRSEGQNEEQRAEQSKIDSQVQDKGVEAPTYRRYRRSRDLDAIPCCE